MHTAHWYSGFLAFRVWGLFGLFLLFTTLTTLPPAAIGQDQITLEAIWSGRFFPPSGVRYAWMNNDNYYSRLDENNNLQKISVRNSEDIETLIEGSQLRDAAGESLNINQYTFSSDEGKVLILTERKPVYRHSSTFRTYVYDIGAQKLKDIHEGKPVFYPQFSPDGSKVAFIYENNLYYQILASGKVVQVTEDGRKNHILNGLADWVYEEEFALKHAYHWSPQSNRLAYQRFDESRVREFILLKYGSLYPDEYRFKYPKAGEENAIVTVHIYDLQSGNTVRADIGPETDQYIPRIQWAGQRLAILRMNRLQNALDILLADPQTGRTTVLLNEKTDTYFDPVGGNSWDNAWHFLNDGQRWVWQSERSGFNHLYLYDMQGKLLRQITAGAWEVSNFYGVDETNGQVYYQSTEVSPMQRHLYRIGLDGQNQEQLSDLPGWHSASFSSAYSFYISRYSATDTPNYSTLYTADGEVLRILSDKSDLEKRLAGLDLSPQEFFTFETSEGVQLNGWMIKPPSFRKRRKHPVLMYVYGGPGSQQVVNRYNPTNFFWYQMLAREGYIVVCVDNRGTGGRGAEFKKVTYQELGKLETVDQIEAAKWLARQPYVDPDRIGIWGWSYGGYMSTLCLLKGNDVFKSAIAVAPVSNWRYYDTIYTERYLRTPQENADGYDRNSPIHYVDRLEGHYLLIHGLADDNVHPQNAIELTTALVKAGKAFEHFLYPNKAHGISGGGTRLHLYRKLTDFIRRKL